MPRRALPSLTLATLCLAAAPAAAAPDAGQAQGMVVLDYQAIPVPGLKSLDLAGVHFFSRFNDWLHLGVGAYAPLARGEYGGFMAVDATAHVQRRLHGRWFGAAGLAAGGGGGGKSAEQSKVLSGTGGYWKAYAGVGYEFDGFSVGLNVSRFRFTGSLIDHTQPNLFVQVPFGYRVGGYADAGSRWDGPAGSGESMATLALDNLHQIDPQASNKGTISTVNLQFARFFAGDIYWFIDAGLGWRGLPLYNHVLGGVGRRWRVSPSFNLYGQLGLGSGGYAPDTLDTGPGLLVYPKLAAEYMVSRNLGVALTAGYLAAPRGSSKNATLGAALNWHFNPPDGGDASPELLRGMRMHLLHQTEFDVSVANSAQANLRLLTMQLDLLAGERLYIPAQISVATNAYADYPGYGEVLFGAGAQTRHERGDRWQFFGQLLVGPNVHGLVVKPQLGLSFGFTERLALSAQVGKTIGVGNYGQNTNKQKLRANAVSLGLVYRFSVPGR